MSVDTLYSLCNRHHWFTCGDCRQYDKLFTLARNGASLKDLALVIWLCSSEQWQLNDILLILKTENNQ